jgi:hypothetical protein
MNKIKETNSGDSAKKYRITQHYLGEVGGSVSQEELDNAVRFAGGDFALELKGNALNLFRVIVQEAGVP